MKEKEKSLFSIYNSLIRGVNLLTFLRLQFSHQNEHKFRHGFADTINAMCACGSEVENTEHFLLRLFQNHEKNDSSFLNLNVKDKFSFLLYGSQTATSKIFNHDTLKIVISYTKDTGRFVE